MAEASWQLAAERFAAALAVAPPDADTRHLRLDFIRARVPSIESSRNWIERREAATRLAAELAPLVPDFNAESSAPLGNFQLEALEVALQVQRFLDSQQASTDLIAIARRLGDQPANAANNARLAHFLHRQVQTGGELPSRDLQELRPLLRSVQVNAPTRDLRAWAAFVLALRLDPQKSNPTEHFQAWQIARQLAAGTSVEADVAAGWYLWRALRGWSPDRQLGEPSDIAALFEEGESIRLRILTDGSPAARDEFLNPVDRLLRQWSDPVRRINFAPHYLPDAPIDFSYAVAGVSQLHFELQRQDPFAARAQGRTDTLDLSPPGETVGSWTLTFDDAEAMTWHTGVHQLTPQLGPGYYALKIRSESVRGEAPPEQDVRFTVGAYQAMLVSSPLKETPDELLLIDLHTGAPVGGAMVRGFCHAFPNEVHEWNVTTDATGRAQAPLIPSLDRHRWTRNVLYGESNGHVFVITDHSSYDHDGLVADLVLDRPLYRPGETLHWKLIVRQRGAGRWQTPVGNFGIRLFDTKSTTLFSQPRVALDAFGSIDGAFDIPSDAPVGYVRIELEYPDGRTTTLPRIFLIDNYVPPALSTGISFAGASDGLRLGQDVPIRISARYLSGGPAVGAKVEVTVQSDTTYLDQDRSDTDSTTTLHGTTDADGETTLTWSPPHFSADVIQTQLEIQAQVLPAGGQPVTKETTWNLTPAGFVAEIDQDGSPLLAAPGEAVVFTGQIVDGTDAPIRFSGAAELVQLRWQGVYLNELQEVVDHRSIPANSPSHRLPEGWIRLHEGYVETVVDHGEIEADANGQFSFQCTAPPNGLYRVRIRDRDPHLLDDPSGGPPPRMLRSQIHPPHRRDQFALVVADQSTTELPLPPGSPVLFLNDHIPQNSVYRALLVRSNSTQPALLTVARESGTHSQLLAAGPRLHWIDLSPYTTEAGTVQIQVGSLDKGGLATREFEIEPAVPPVRLEVDVPASVRPGETTRIVVETRHSDGAPQRAQILHTVADDAVLQLFRQVGSSDAPYIAFNDTANFVGIRRSNSARPREHEFKPILDWRPGAIVQATGAPTTDDANVMLAPLSVRSVSLSAYGASGYQADEGSALAYTQSLEPPPQLAGSGDSGSPRLRRHFASTAAWLPDIETDAAGRAEFEFTYPDNLTSWHHKTYALTADGRFIATATSKSRAALPLQARLQTPRFLIAGDTSNPSVTVVDRTGRDSTVSASLLVEGEAAHLSNDSPSTQKTPVSGDAEIPLFWKLEAVAAGSVLLTGSVANDDASDAMQIPLVVHEDGIEQHLAASTRLRAGASSASLTLELPQPLDPGRTTARLQLASSPAVAALDALPYLIDYPYGCVEQTMSRFLPAVVVRTALLRLGLEPAAVEARILGHESTSDAQRRLDTAGLSELDEVIRRSLRRLTSDQHQTGGWGWWPGGEQDDPWMTAYVTWSLGQIQRAGVALEPSMLDRAGARCAHIAATSGFEIDDRAWALAACASLVDTPADLSVDAVLAELFSDRDALSPSARAALALAVAKFGDDEQRAIITRNLVNHTVQESSDLGTLVHWGQVQGHYRALEGATEATAVSILALLHLDTSHPLIEPAIAWLSLNRRSAHWESTRATSFAVLALTRHLESSAVNDPVAQRLEVQVNNHPLETVDLSPTNLLAQPISLTIPVDQLNPASNRIELRRTTTADTATVYATALVETWATGDGVKPASHVISVKREFERLVPTPTVAGPVRFTSTTLERGDTSHASEQIDVQVRVSVPHDLRYVMVAVPKPAGCEPLNPLSGWDATLRPWMSPGVSATASNERRLFREEKDDHSAVFIDRLDAGEWQITLRLRAVTPGDYRALPARVEAMYVPEITANSDARRLHIAGTENSAP